MARFGRRMPHRALAGVFIVLALGAGSRFAVTHDGVDDARQGSLTRAVQGAGNGALRSMQDRGQAVSDRAPARLSALYADAADAAAAERTALEAAEVPSGLRDDLDRLAALLSDQETALRGLSRALDRGDTAAQRAHTARLERAASALTAARGRLTHRLRTAA